jgi:hypothetical protein
MQIPVRGLGISHLFSPLLTPRAIRLGILSSYLQKAGMVHWDIVCAEPKSTIFSNDFELLKLINREIHVCRTRSYETRYLRWLGRRIFPFTLLTLPDAHIGWLPGAVRKVNHLLDTEKYDFVYSFSYPPTSHLVAAVALKNRKIPWLLFLSDPWSHMPLLREDPLKRHINFLLEKLVFQKAQGIIFPCEEGLEWTLSKHPVAIRRKAYVLPHCFDGSLYSIGKILKPELRKEQRLRLLHAGSFYGTRTPAPLFLALKTLRDDYPSCYRKLEVVLIGEKHESINKQSKDHGLQDVVSTVPTVSYLTALSMMRTADILVTIEASADRSPFFPSKLVDYLGAGKPLLGITPPGSPTAKVLLSLRQRNASPFSKDEITEAILDLYRLWIQGTLGKSAPLSEMVRPFSVERVADKQMQILEKILKFPLEPSLSFT